MATGGFVARGGVAEIHRGEQVLDREATQLLKDFIDTATGDGDGGLGGQSAVIQEGAIQIDAAGADAEEVADILDRRLDRLLGR